MVFHVIRRKEEGTPPVTARSNLDQIQKALPTFLSLYKPFGRTVAVGSSLLNLAHTLYAYRNPASGSTQIELAIRSLVATASVAGTFFAHPMGMGISTIYELITQSQQLYLNIQEGNYENGLQCACKIAGNSLYLMALLSCSTQWIVGALIAQSLLGVSAARQALAEGNYIEAGAHLTLIAVRGHQIAGLLEQERPINRTHTSGQLNNFSINNAAQSKQVDNTIIPLSTVDRLLQAPGCNVQDEITHILHENPEITPKNLLDNCVARFQQTNPAPPTPEPGAITRALPESRSADTLSDLVDDLRRARQQGRDVDPKVAQWIDWLEQFIKFNHLTLSFLNYNG